MVRWISDYSEKHDCRQFQLVFAYRAFSSQSIIKKQVEKQMKKDANDSDDDNSDSDGETDIED